jgi:hypothetical protein
LWTNRQKEGPSKDKLTETRSKTKMAGEGHQTLIPPVSSLYENSEKEMEYAIKAGRQ